MRAIFLGALILATAGCCTSSSPEPQRVYVYQPGVAPSGAQFVECRDASGSLRECEHRFSDFCHGDYVIVPRGHVHDYDSSADDTVWIATCH